MKGWDKICLFDDFEVALQLPPMPPTKISGFFKEKDDGPWTYANYYGKQADLLKVAKTVSEEIDKELGGGHKFKLATDDVTEIDKLKKKKGEALLEKARVVGKVSAAKRAARTKTQ